MAIFYSSIGNLIQIQTWYLNKVASTRFRQQLSSPFRCKVTILCIYLTPLLFPLPAFATINLNYDVLQSVHEKVDLSMKHPVGNLMLRRRIEHRTQNYHWNTEGLGDIVDWYHIYKRISLNYDCWCFGLDNPLGWEPVLCIVGYWVASLPSPTRYQWHFHTLVLTIRGVSRHCPILATEGTEPFPVRTTDL
jgi:hypothetical protein